MTEPNEINEEINEELSTDELKNVSGGIRVGGNALRNGSHNFTWREDGANRLSNGIDAKGSGSVDWCLGEE